MAYLDNPRLRGMCLTFIARGDPEMPLRVLAKTARTYVRKGRISPTELSAVLDEVRRVGVEDFEKWPTWAERGRRFGALVEALSGVAQ